jgi:hypothetical protein
MKQHRLTQAEQLDWGKQQRIVEKKQCYSKYIHTSESKKSKHSLNVSVEVK